MKEPADCSKDPFPDFEELLANPDLEYESVRSRSMTKKDTRQDPKESPVPNKKSPGTPASDARQNLKSDAKLGDASESISDISKVRRSITSFRLPEIGYYSFARKYYRHPQKQYFPVFDMRYTIGSIILPCPDVNISPSTELDKIREDAANLLSVPKEDVLFLYKEISHLQTDHLGILIVVDPVHSESHILILLLVDRDVDMESENWSHSAYKMNTRTICCVLFPKGEKVFKLKQELQEKYKLPMDHFALILNKKKVKETYKIEDAVKSYDFLILEKHMPIDIQLVWRQYPNFKQVIDIVGISSLHTISSLKKVVIKAFSELQPILLTVENICFSKQDVLLDNDVILSYIQGLPQRYHSDRHKVSLKLHLVHPIYTWFKIDTITASRTRIVEVVCVNPKSSTCQLRTEVAKISMCQSQALKLVASGKKIPEKERIEEIPFLQEGCTIKASVSSKVRVNITVMTFSGQKEENIEKFQVKIYKLDTVLKLKQIVVKSLQSPVEMYMCDLKKECVMEESRLLRDYGIINETDIMACIFKHRIKVTVVIPKTKKKIQVFIDEPKSTTVQDFLVYAKTQGLIDVHYSGLRLLYKDRCLPLESSLCNANVQHETMLVITTVAKMCRGTIIMCPEKTGEALCATGIVIQGRIYYGKVFRLNPSLTDSSRYSMSAKFHKETPLDLPKYNV